MKQNKQEEKKLDFKKIEEKWQKKWEKARIFEAKEDKKKKKYYVLEMYPYPSGSGLHMGHNFNYTIGDIYSRFKRMNNFSVLYPMGFDSFGLPAENAAIKAGKHPKKHTEDSIKNFIKQQKELGLSYDWNRMLYSHDPSYYKWNQYFFLKFFEKGLVYRKKSAVNYCSKCDTVLANEQVHNGKCWRHTDNEVEIKHLEQWFIRTTRYSDELLDVDKLDWPERIKIMQKNWIGKSYGTEIDFEIEADNVKGKEFVFLHGYKFSIDDDFWGWLKKEIKSRGGKIIFDKNLPNYKDNPNCEQQMKFVLENCSFNEDTIIISHSLGNILAMKLLEKLNSKIGKWILVAPPSSLIAKYRAGRPYQEQFCDWNFNYESIKQKTNEIIILVDKGDKEKRIESARYLADKLGIKEEVVSANKMHFNSEKEPSILQKIILTTKWPIFTTRPDTIFGVTFMVVSCQHPKLMELVTKEQKEKVEKFLKKLGSVSEKELEEMEKEGVFTGSYAVNPLTKEKVPVYAGNFVVADYGSGMVMAVPSHDQRDFEFAKKYGLKIKEVIIPVFGKPNEKAEFRKTISAVIHRKKDNKFLFLKWKKFNWISPVVGGIENSEDIFKAAEREVLEETGYRTRAIRKLGGETEEHFFADNKNVFRHRVDQPILLELVDDKQGKIDKDEQEKHEVVWLDEDEALKKITHEYNKIGILRYLGKEEAYTGNGKLVNSGKFSGMDNEQAKEKITLELEKMKLGKKTIQYKFRDWLISRQRYWGTPIPMIYCEKCGIVPVPEKDLPVKLPEKVKFGKGNPLATSKEFLNVKCPKCNGKARRETDTMDTFFDSSWYYMRYCDPENVKRFFDIEKIKYWMPVDIYIGGAEHACMHLLYARFFTKALRDMKLVNFDEPFTKLFNQGMLHGKDGFVMSKSRGNVVLPEEVSRKYGIDTARLFLMSVASPDKDTTWSDDGIEGSLRFILKVVNYFENLKTGKSSEKIYSKYNQAIREVSEDIENLRYNLAIIKIREFFDALGENESKEVVEGFLKLFSVFCPHISEELWEKMGNKNFISLENWPKFDESKINLELEKEEQQVENTVNDIRNIIKILKEKQGKEAKKVFLYVIPKEIEIYKENKEAMMKNLGLEVEIYAVNDKNKHDPQNKSGKAKLGKPAIYVE